MKHPSAHSHKLSWFFPQNVLGPNPFGQPSKMSHSKEWRAWKRKREDFEAGLNGLSFPSPPRCRTIFFGIASENYVLFFFLFFCSVTFEKGAFQSHHWVFNYLAEAEVNLNVYCTNKTQFFFSIFWGRLGELVSSSGKLTRGATVYRRRPRFARVSYKLSNLATETHYSTNH